MSAVEAKSPVKRKGLPQDKKGSAKKPKLNNPKTPQKGVSPKQQNKNQQNNSPNSSQKFNKNKQGKRNKGNSESENDSSKKLKPFKGTQAANEKIVKKNKGVEKGDDSAGDEKKKRKRNQYHVIFAKIESGDKQEALTIIEEKLQVFEGRDDLSKTAKRKLKTLLKYKKLAGGHVEQKTPQNKSVGKKNEKKLTKQTQKAAQSEELKTNGKANKNAKKEKKVPQAVIKKQEEEEEDDSDEGDSDEELQVEGEEEDSGEEEESDAEGESGEEDDDAEEGEQVEEEDDDEDESDDDGPPPPKVPKFYDSESDEFIEEEEYLSDEELSDSENEFAEEFSEQSGESFDVEVDSADLERYLEDAGGNHYSDSDEGRWDEIDEIKKSSDMKNSPSKNKPKVEKTTKENTVNLDQLKSNNLMTKNQKRFVLFIGNIPYDATKQDLVEHFKKSGEIRHIRIPTEKNSTKQRGFAYLELENEESYQKCMSMHHTFLKGRRINVLYTQGGKKKGDDRKKEIKAKNFKLHALRKQGKLAGSQKESQKRSFRRAKQKASKGGSEGQQD